MDAATIFADDDFKTFKKINNYEQVNEKSISNHAYIPCLFFAYNGAEHAHYWKRCHRN